MKAKTEKHLPGIYFEAEPRPLAKVLPRMDIAAFVGFASCGPLNIPVSIEDIDRFHDIFGDPLPIARNPLTGQIQYAHLASGVNAFFENGGRRCWVVRVAKDAKANRFSLPGLLRADNWRPALSIARCEGSWSDTLRAATVRRSEALGLLDLQLDPDAYCLDLAASSARIAQGDLLQLSFGKRGPLLFLVADSTETLSVRNYLTGNLPVIRVKSTQGHWFFRTCDPPPPFEGAEAFLLTPDEEQPLPLSDVLMPEESGDIYGVDLDIALDSAPSPGDILRIDFQGGRCLLLPLTKDAQVIPGASPHVEGVRVCGEGGLWKAGASQGIDAAVSWQEEGLLQGRPFAERISFDIIVWDGEEILSSFNNVAFSKKNTRFWAKLPTDRELFELPGMKKWPEEPNVLKQEASEPRFPLAGPEDPPELYLPIGMPLIPLLSASSAPLDMYGPDTALERDGLENFGPDLFLDADLASTGSELLLTEANHKYYQRCKPLSGIHSLLPINEITIIAVPDAIHLGWQKTGPLSPELLHAPVLGPVTVSSYQASDQCGYQISWSQITGAAKYRLQQATDPDFTHPDTIYEGGLTIYEGSQPIYPGSHATYQGKQVTANIPSCRQKKGCPRLYYYRVCAICEGRISPWSNTVRAFIPVPDFVNCIVSIPDAPYLEPILHASPAEDDYLLHWSSVPGATRYELQESTDPSFGSGETFYYGPETGFRVITRYTDEILFYRVRAAGERGPGPWSQTRFFIVPSSLAWSIKLPGDYTNEGLLSIQRALLRLCSARGDLFALMAQPNHYCGDESIAHTKALRAYNEGNIAERDLSFGAIYHPWIQTRLRHKNGVTSINSSPPEGAVCGIFASRAIARGAWVAPANEPLKAVVSIGPAIGDRDPGRFFDAQLNLIGQGVRGFLLLSAQTLSPESSLRQINVRRLLILLRRMAMLEGMRYVFQPNDADFRILVKNRFEHLLSDLYALGAFRGDTPQTAYRVICDNSVNTPESLKQGRFIIELCVAPSRPLEFITLRLLQTGHEKLAIREY